MIVDRKELAYRCFQRGDSLTLENREYSETVRCLITCLYRDDLRNGGDITTGAILRGSRYKTVHAIIEAQQKGIIAGIEEVTWFYQQNRLEVVEQYKNDGDIIENGDRVLKLNGQQKNILKTERVGLNILQRMSGIATSTREFCDKVHEVNPDIIVTCTRKTPLGVLDKKPVYLGGGGTHRLYLGDSILIKNNHLEALRQGGIEDVIGKSLNRACNYEGKPSFIEIEVKNENEAFRAAEKFRELQLKYNRELLCVIMLDNFTPKEIQYTIKELKKRSLYGYSLCEASGGINLYNCREYAGTGVDVLSSGELTHSSRAIGIHQIII